jgi:hypothetical protein
MYLRVRADQKVGQDPASRATGGPVRSVDATSLDRDLAIIGRTSSTPSLSSLLMTDPGSA